MNLKKAAVMLALATAGAQFAAGPALAGAPDERDVWEMLKRSAMMRADGTISRADFIKLMGQRFDMMDKGRRGVLSAAEIAKLLDPNVANP